jgi:hypothetical protein
LAPRVNQKLAFKFFMPFKIIQKVGSVAYRLELPSSSGIHPVFHVSLLNKVVGKSQNVSSVLPSEDVELQVLEKVLGHCMIARGIHPIRY